MLILIDGNRTLKIDVTLQDATALLRFLNAPNYEKIIYEDTKNKRLLTPTYDNSKQIYDSIQWS